MSTQIRSSPSLYRSLTNRQTDSQGKIELQSYSAPQKQQRSSRNAIFRVTDVGVPTLPGREGPTLWDKILTLFNRSHLTAALEKHWKENLELFWKLRTLTLFRINPDFLVLPLGDKKILQPAVALSQYQSVSKAFLLFCRELGYLKNPAFLVLILWSENLDDASCFMPFP